MAADNPDCEGAIATDFISQMGETTKEAKEFLKLLYIELPDGINLARVRFKFATAQHVHRMQGKDAAPDRQLECSSMILRPPVCLLLEIAACKSWSLGSTIGHDICQSAHKWCGLWSSIYSWLSLRQIARMQKGAQQASTETLESGRPRCLL